MIKFTTYLATSWQPLLMLLIGLCAVLLVGYIQWFGSTRKTIVQWIGKYIFRDKYGSQQSADSLFMVITSFLVAVGGVWIVVAILFLTN